jgi:hypothetical protein
VTTVHRVLGAVIVVLFAVLMVVGLALRIAGRRETPGWVWAVQHWTENLLVLQTVGGIALLVLGRRVVDEPFSWFHYLYGSLFPLIAVVAGRLAGLRRGEREYVGLAWGAFVAFALVLRAVQTGCGLSVPLTTCFGF